VKIGGWMGYGYLQFVLLSSELLGSFLLPHVARNLPTDSHEQSVLVQHFAEYCLSLIYAVVCENSVEAPFLQYSLLVGVHEAFGIPLFSLLSVFFVLRI
jgi:hypothetical protein